MKESQSTVAYLTLLLTVRGSGSNLAMIYEESTGFDAQFHIKMYFLLRPLLLLSTRKA
jgi:hypothetical protein